MNQEGCSSKNKKISNRIPAGSLASLRNQRVSSLTTKRTFQATRSNENEERQSEAGLPPSLRNQKLSLLTTKRVLNIRLNANEERQSELGSQLQEQVQKVTRNSTSSAAQRVHE